MGSKAMPTRREFSRLEAAGRVKQIAFTKNHAAADIERLLLFHFPCLVDLDLTRLRFITSYDKGHAMSVVFRHIPSGEEIMAQFTQGPKQKVYIYWKGPASVNLDDALPSSSTATSSTLPSTVTPTASTSSNPIPSVSLIPSSTLSTPVPTSTISSPVASFNSTGVNQPALATTMSRPSNGRETRRYLEHLAAGDNRPAVSLRTSDDDDNDDAVFMQSVFSDDVIEIDPPAINNFPVETPTSMESSTAKGYKGSPFYGSGLKGGLVVEDISSSGLGGSSNRVSRVDEVAECQKMLQRGNERTAMLPFLIHSFEELCWQAREDNKGMIVVLLNSRRKGDANRGTLLRILHNVESRHDNNWLFWVADSWSSDGRKVFHTHGGDQRRDRLLFLTPSTGRNATLLGEIADTETDTCDAVLQNIMARAALHITDEHQQREQYVKWRKERKEQEEELSALQKKHKREKQECKESEKPKVTASEKDETVKCYPCDDHDATVHKIREDREKRVSPEPEEGTTIILRFKDQKLSRKFAKNAMFQEVYDWAGAMSTMPLHFTIQRRSEVVLHEHHIKRQEVLDIYEREENEVKRLLNSQVSFKGNLPCDVQEILETTADEKQYQENKKQVDREQRVMKTKEGKQQEEKTEKSRETDCCSVSELQQEPGVDSKRKKKKEKRSGSQRKKIKKIP
ncbi:uncharacterized protein [Montipora foliosa]|uniref:uncharacterized protein isoform X2 n=1 Tax=Montipora foliosa TaxID=591990 RepID=UPI0035F11FDE